MSAQRKQQQEEWRKSVDSDSIKAVFNILPETFLERIESGLFDCSLIERVPGGDYQVPIYYVTKAWDVLLKSSLGYDAFRIGPEEDDEEDYESALQEFIKEERISRTRPEAVQQNDQIKDIWKQKFSVDIDALDIDFSQYNKHFHPNVDLPTFRDYFFDPLHGVTHWILEAVNHPDYEIFPESVSSLMEFAAFVKLGFTGEKRFDVY